MKGRKRMDKKQEAIDILKEYNQEHIIKLLEKLDDKKQEELIEQIHKIDFHQMLELYNNAKKEIVFKESKIEPLKYLDKAKLTDSQRNKFDELGKEVIKKGQYAVVTMAGGQGTRLGHPGPKGTFKLDVYGKGKYLFEILVDNLKEAKQKYGVTIPWYIMTSKENHDETVEFLEKNNYFGYDKKYVTIFTQSELPLIDEQGKMLIGKDLKIKEHFRWINRFYDCFDLNKALTIAKMFDLDINKKFRSLSKGYQSIFKLTAALSLNIPYVIFDEPVLGLDANHRELFYELLLQDFENNERTIIIATHLIEEVTNIIEEVVLIDHGKIILQDTVESLLETGYSVSGISHEVDQYCSDKNVIGHDELGNMKIAYILDNKTSIPPDSSLHFSSMNLQKLFVKLTEKGGK